MADVQVKNIIVFIKYDEKKRANTSQYCGTNLLLSLVTNMHTHDWNKALHIGVCSTTVKPFFPKQL